MSGDLLEKYTSRLHSERTDSILPGEPEPVDDFSAFGFLRGARDRALMLELRKKDGNVIALGYAWLEKAEFDPSVGITLHFGSQKITIRGRNLNAEIRPNVRLFQSLLRHRVPWIQEADEPAAMQAGKGDTLVERIEW